MEKQSLSLREKVRQYKNVPVILIHIDTTGLGNDDEVIRLSILSDNILVYDEIYHVNKAINPQAARVSGISNDMVQQSNKRFVDDVFYLTEMLNDKLLVCVNENFTKKFLSRAGLDLRSDNLIDLTKATDFFARDTIRSAGEMLKFYGYDTNMNLTTNTFDRTFIYYDCACKLQMMAVTLMKH